MRSWKATTETGTTYTRTRGFVVVDSKRHGKTTIRLWSIMVALVDEDAVTLGTPWDNPEQWAVADEPVIGRRLYVSGRDEWRISTPIVSVEFTDAH